MSKELSRRDLADDVEYVLESLTQGYRSEAKFELFKLLGKLEAQAQQADPVYVDVLRDLRSSEAILVGLPNDGDRNALKALWRTQKRLRSRS